MSPDVGGGHPRWFQTFDVLVVVACGVLASVAVGAVWSYVRVGAVIGLFVREWLFVVSMLAFGLWAVRNRSGGRIDEVNDEGTVPVPPPDSRVAAYRRLTGDRGVTASDALETDAYLFAVAVALFGLSIGVELLLLSL